MNLQPEKEGESAMMTVHQVAGLAGISERTLRYYDKLNLLTPSDTTEAGYRLYGEADLERLQRILFLRELDFPLKDIAPMLEAEADDRRLAVERHRELLRLKAERLQGLIDLCGRILKGEGTMSLKEFDGSGVGQRRDEYAREARERWGDTEAYRESERRTATYGKKEWAEVQAEGDGILKEFAALVGQDPTGPAVRAALARWQEHISRRYYRCTDEILAGLGEMYMADERFTRTLDGFGAGTAALMSEAIRRRKE
ncbi:MAG: MerR family transcriptional regulator [Clostridiales bacterium]|nr:MerR family transcriptional regulator [Clostridiales bacterium]